ncbi:hypothetical protein ACTFIV_006780 [Dictyostelium citrinum]
MLQTTSNWLVEIPLTDGQTLSFYVTYKNGISPTIKKEEMIDLTFYPDQSTIVTMPVTYSKIITFKMTSNITNQPYFNLYNNGFNLAVRPILGCLGNITYISSCYYSSSIMQRTLYHQNGQSSFIGDFFFDTTQSCNLLNRLKYNFKSITYSSNPDYDTYSESFPYGFISGNNLNYNITYSVKSFQELYPLISIGNPPNLPLDRLGWLITIEDKVNGFRDGYITVRGSTDSSLYNFTIDPTKSINGGDKWIGDYKIYIRENQLHCISQSYEIIKVVLYDTCNNKASYIKFQINEIENTKFNPFINYLDDVTIVAISPPNLICNAVDDTSAPILTSFTSSVKGLDVGSLNDRSVTFEFECQDNESEIIISVYGFINNGGYSTQSLKELGFDYSIRTIDQFIENQPIIQSTNTITNQGGKLMIYGRKLNCDDLESPTNSLIPTVSPIPTNPPQKCQGNPECGGVNQGTCKNGGCICYLPFIGLTCTSQIIIVPPPTINNTNPSTEITIPSTTDSENGNNENIIFKSLISLVSLRELNFEGKEIQIFNFEKWIYTPLDTTTTTITNITTTLEWFNNSEIIEFANQKLEMNPSSVKYTIEISKYPFQSTLNTLQLVMSAQLSKTNNIDDTCSSKEFGNTTNGDDSNFLKIQVDSTVRSIENVQLDQSMNPISKSYSAQSYIASSNSENSICSNNSSSLSGGQISGIVIGGVAFLAVIATCTIYSFHKKKEGRALKNSFNMKRN